MAPLTGSISHSRIGQWRCRYPGGPENLFRAGLALVSPPAPFSQPSGSGALFHHGSDRYHFLSRLVPFPLIH